MKKLGIVLLILCTMFVSVGFASDEGENYLSSNHKFLFTIPIDDLDNYDMIDFDYNPNDHLIYIITEDDMELDDETYKGYQFTFDLNKQFNDKPEFPEIENYQRMGIEFEGSHAYSLEYDAIAGASYVYDHEQAEVLGIYDEEEYNGFAVQGNLIAFHRDREREEVNFDIGTVNPFVSSNGTVEIESIDAGRIGAFDFSSDGTEFFYGAYTCKEKGIGAGLRIRGVSTKTGDLIDEFLISVPEGIDMTDLDDGMENSVRSLYVTDRHLVVFVKIYDEEIGFIQKYTYDGQLIESFSTDYCIKFITEGPNGTTLYLRENPDDSDYTDLMQIFWKKEEIGRPKAMISERTVGGQTTAVFRDNGFGLLKTKNEETGAMNYRAPLKSDEAKVRLRIPFEDLQGKISAGAENLLIEYHGKDISIPMSSFDCSELLNGIPCQDDATIEIQMSYDESGNVTMIIQLYVVEQIDEMTRVVHRKTIQ